MNLLSAKTNELWDEYQRAERECVRKNTLSALDQFIDAFDDETPTAQETWALSVSESISDHALNIPIRLPLFQRVLLPYLASGVLENKPGCARWLAHFQTRFSLVFDPRLPEGLKTTVGLLKAALALDSEDDSARRPLVEHHASYMNYTLHELPAGVLYGHNGATPGECEELLELLSEFAAHVRLLDESEKYVVLVNECQHHYNAYLDYLRAGRPEGSYARFLESRMQPTLPDQP